MTFLAKLLAALFTGGWVNTTANSSPPRRATKSSPRKISLSLFATIFSTASPTSCPSESLIFLNRSKSINNRYTWCFCLCACARLRLIKSWKYIRLGKPVNGSWFASLLSSVSTWLRSENAAATNKPPKIITTRPILSINSACAYSSGFSVWSLKTSVISAKIAAVKIANWAIVLLNLSDAHSTNTNKTRIRISEEPSNWLKCIASHETALMPSRIATASIFSCVEKYTFRYESNDRSNGTVK